MIEDIKEAKSFEAYFLEEKWIIKFFKDVKASFVLS